ncbi:MAG: hypothetical protein ACI4MC_06505 [Candidatus Coproplasma sp.]
MKKLMKRISIVLLTVCAVFACAFALSACSKSYTFVIQYEDGTPFNDTTASTQICVNEACYPLMERNIYPDANGKITLTQKQVNEICGSDTDVTEFVFHVVYVEGYADDCEFEINGAKEYTCKLYKD